MDHGTQIRYWTSLLLFTQYTHSPHLSLSSLNNVLTDEVFTDTVMRNTVQYIQYSQQLRQHERDISSQSELLYQSLQKLLLTPP